MNNDKVLTYQQRQKYFDNPNRCPWCEGANIESGDYNGEGDFGDPKHLWCIMSCEDCGGNWVDHFKLVDVTEAP